MDRERAASRRGASGRDSLEVSLHDVDLAQEVELLSHVMVAANETEQHRLCQSDVDRILGVVLNGVPAQGVRSSGVPAQGAPSAQGVPSQRRSAG